MTSRTSMGPVKSKSFVKKSPWTALEFSELRIQVQGRRGRRSQVEREQRNQNSKPGAISPAGISLILLDTSQSPQGFRALTGVGIQGGLQISFLTKEKVEEWVLGVGGSQRLCLSLSELGSILVPQSCSSQGRGWQQNNGTYPGEGMACLKQILWVVWRSRNTKWPRWWEHIALRSRCNVAETAVCLLSINFLLFH